MLVIVRKVAGLSSRREGIVRGIRSRQGNYIPAVLLLAQSFTAGSVALARTCHELEWHGNAILIVGHFCGVFWVV